MLKRIGDFFGRVNVQVSLICAIMMVVTSALVIMLSVRFAAYTTADAYRHTSDVVSEVILADFEDDILDKFNSADDMKSAEYAALNESFRAFRTNNGIEDIILVKKNQNGENVYAVDSHGAGEIGKRTGDLVEEKLSEKIDHLFDAYYHKEESYFIDTDEGYKFYAIYPVSRDIRNARGVLCVEIDAQQCVRAVIFVIILTLILIIALISIVVVVCNRVFKKISNPLYQDITNTDALTGLKNKNSFTTDMHNIEGMSSKEKYGVVVIDLNGLKSINDTRGHNIGDRYIQDSARVIQRTMFGKNQVAYRTGGDEFAVILKDMTPDELKELLEKFDENIVKSNKDNYIKLSMSIGYAFFDSKRDRYFYDTYQRADNMMYDIKREFYRQKAEREESINNGSQE